VIKVHLHRRNIFRIIALWVVLSLAILACGAGGGAPDTAAPEDDPAIAPTSVAPEEPAEDDPSVIIPLPTQLPAATAIPAIPERRRLTLEFPPQIRTGDSDVVRLTLEVDDLGNITPTAQVEGNVVTGEVVEIPNLHETHNVIAEAKFDIAGLQISPTEVISQTLSQGQTVTFFWSVRPQEAGTFRGTIWFYLRFVDKVSGEESQKTVSAQLVEIEAVNLFGLPGNVARTFGGVGSVIGAVVGFPFFEDIVRFIFGRRKARRK
jgi:hypothetical protein